MTNESQYEEDAQVTEEEKRHWEEEEEKKRHWDELEAEERRRGQANIEDIEGKAAEVYEYKENAADVNNKRLETEANAIRRKRDEEISACFEAVKKKADEEQRDRSASKASKETIDSLPEIVKSIARNLRNAVDQMHLGLTKAKELILESARVLDEEHVEEQDKICKKIKEILKDKIQEGKISEGWIEECLPREYKRKYTKTESQQNHLSGVQHPELVVSTKGNQISQSDKPSDINNKAPDTEAITSFERQEDQSPSAGEAFPPAADVNSMRKADEIPRSESKIIIPKENHQMMRYAMKKSKNAIFVICDESKKFVRVVADVDN